MDYRELNRNTIKNKFHISLVEDLYKTAFQTHGEHYE